MHLFAALVPPREALERVRTLVAAIAPVPEPSAGQGSSNRGSGTCLLYTSDAADE